MTDLDPKDIRVSAYSSKSTAWTLREPAGIRVIHLPTGIEVVCEQHRSQHQNRAVCLDELRMKLNGQY